MVMLLGAVLGLVIGSFLNVVVWRVPRGESVAHPPSACPRCGHRVRARDNVPVLSWLLLRGRCRDCSAPIGARYPAVEAGTAVAFALVGWWLGWSWALPAFWYLVAVSVALTLIDLDVRRLPDVIVLPSWVVGVLLLTVASWDSGQSSDWGALGRALIAAVVMGASYLLILLVYPAGMGLGDVKLAVLLGLYLGWIGWSALVVGWFAGFLLGGIVGVVLLLTRRAGRSTQLPFGPWMLAGCWIGLVVGPTVAAGYLELVGL
ncbi:prepilin peptidase [Cellulomonas sp. NPDC089187]|uniref:prepilin peptidase n=1 Tax=Cellulomonas sp. NPDC089187 TaxID=3154970 RepID=UPI00344A72E2